MHALICGAGALPGHVAAAMETPPVVCALRGFEPDGLTPEITFRIETLGSLIAWLQARGVGAVCFCGNIRRPEIDPDAIDAATAPLVPRLTEAVAMGDDGALRVVLALFAEAGFAILAAHEAAPDLLPPAGVPTRAQPGDAVRDALPVAEAEIARLGAADAGQACVIRDGRVVASEGPEGTDAMLRGVASPAAGDPVSWAMDRTGDLLGAAADWLSNSDENTGFLYKAPKPGQDRRADLPVIGPGTAVALKAAGLAGAVVEAGGVMVLDRARTLADFDAAGLFLWIREGRA
jgi:hypothetical protein